MALSLEAAAEVFREAMRDTVKRYSLWYQIQGGLLIAAGILAIIYARRPLPGMLEFQDGSNHAWLPQGPPRDLIVTMDDATSAILSAVLVEEEGTPSSFVGLKEVIAEHGSFSALYTARGSHYFYTPSTIVVKL